MRSVSEYPSYSFFSISNGYKVIYCVYLFHANLKYLDSAFLAEYGLKEGLMPVVVPHAQASRGDTVSEGRRQEDLSFHFLLGERLWTRLQQETPSTRQKVHEAEDAVIKVQ